MPVAPNEWQPEALELAGKTLLITGASEGIGRAVAFACAQSARKYCAWKKRSAARIAL